MLRATNDPFDVMRQETAKQARELRSSQAASGTQQFQAVRTLREQVDALEQLVIRMPQYEGRQVNASGWGSTPSSWNTIASASIPRPADKTRVVVSANGFVTAISPSSVTVGFRARLLINGAASQFFDAATVGSAITRGSTYPSFVREISGLAGTVTVRLQVDSTSYPHDQRASLSVLAGFSTI